MPQHQTTPSERNARLNRLEAWIEAVRDGWWARRFLEADSRHRHLTSGDADRAAVALTKIDADGIPAEPLPERGAWVALPTAAWSESKLAKARGQLFPFQIVTDFHPQIVPAGEQVAIEWSSPLCGRREHGTAVFAVDCTPTTPLGKFGARLDSHPKALLRRRLSAIVAAGDQAQYDLLRWTDKYRHNAAKSASAHISTVLGVTDGFAISHETLRGVADELEETVLTQLYRYANLPRTRGSAKRPDTDFEMVLKNYIGRESKRLVRRILGVPEQVSAVRRWASADPAAAALPPAAAADAFWRWSTFEGLLDSGDAVETARRKVDAGHRTGARPATSMVQAALVDVTAAPTVSPLLEHDGACNGGLSESSIALADELAAMVRGLGGAYQAASNYLANRLPHHAASTLVAPWMALPNDRVRRAVQCLIAAGEGAADAVWAESLAQYLRTGEPVEPSTERTLQLTLTADTFDGFGLETAA